MTTVFGTDKYEVVGLYGITYEVVKILSPFQVSDFSKYTIDGVIVAYANETFTSDSKQFEYILKRPKP